MIQTNFFTILVAAIVATVAGFLWFGPFFGKEWSRLVGMTPERMEEAKKKGMTGKYIINFLATLVMTYVLSRSFDARGYIGVGEGLWLASWIWLGFVAVVMLNRVIWENSSIKLYWLTTLGYLFMMWVMTFVLIWMR